MERDSSSRDDAAPTRPGQAVIPQHVVAGGIGPDGNFFLDCPGIENEMIGRALCNMIQHELDRFYTNEKMKKAMERVQQGAMVDGMLGQDRAKLERKIRGLR